MRALALFSLLAMLASCILVVSPEEYGNVCRFRGEDTQCGTCIRAHCQGALNDCCRDVTCGSLDHLDPCAEQRSSRCRDLVSHLDPFADCVKRECGAVCVELTGTPTTSCREPRLGEGAACTCSAGGEANDDICSAVVYPGTLCCAPEAWPSPGLECKCQALDCRASPDGCFCRLADFTPKTRECSAVHCCASDDVCTCGSRACSSFEREVPTCAIGELRCAKGQKPVDSCSARTP